MTTLSTPTPATDHTPRPDPTSAPAATPAPEGPTVPQQAGALLGHVAGYMASHIIEMGLNAGLIRALGEQPSLNPEQLADLLDLDDLYTSVWCRGAFGAGVLERSGDGYQLAPHLATLLLDTTSPAYVGGIFPLIQRPEMFGRFAESLPTGERMWWDDTSPEWIKAVAGTGGPFYTRLIPGGLGQVPGLAERLAGGATIVDSACGAGTGVIRLAEHFPGCRITGVDGDPHSVERARERVLAAGLTDRVQVLCQPLEEMHLPEPAALVVNNISMHECRDIDQVTQRVRATLEPGGWFVVSDFPFPESDDGLRTVPGRIMSGIQFFEAQIDDQLLPRSAYDDLLTRHGFADLGTVGLTPMHALTWGRRPA
ncbi:class I SAM-dependent methyltransferase [Ornithinimicrobium faecis]|uniref:class I SAM-dependent methyltransferase n=1 Tax=Ornithinimicrobium faecis TaxID=2934158 RepID=UPI002118D1C7|nr:class I SAM-dependent methyltransferase [Ornithinimicrobium sp. HY1745]